MRFILRTIFLLLPAIAPYTSWSQTAVEFTGANSYIRITDHPDLHLDNFTLACWIMPLQGGEAIASGAPDVNIIPLISRGAHDPSNLQAINFRMGLSAENRIIFLEFEHWSADENAFIPQHISGFTPLQNNKWYHIAASFDGDRIRLYVNGILESMLEVFFQAESSFTADLGIAAAFNSASAPIGSFRGKMDALCIYNKELTHSELLGIMNSEVESAPGDLVLGFNFNEGSGSTLSPLGPVPGANVIPQNLSWSEGAHYNALVLPLSEPDPVLKIGIISDPQYCDCETPDWADRVYRETLNKLPVAIDTLNNREVDFSVTLGDVIDTFFVSYDSILPLYEAFENEHYFLLGNHEFEIEDSLKPLVLGLLDMPDYYYSIDRADWRFLFLDGTELAEYTRVLHPEYADEGDSIRQSVFGEIHDLRWNGGISRDQQAWIRDQIETAATEQRNLILFCHFPVLPDSVHLNLWNKDTIINLIKEYDHVVAYINGHFHEGGYDQRYGKHFLTHFSMVETEDSNSYSVMNIYPSYLRFDGFGYNPDRILRYTKYFQTLSPPEIDNTELHYYHTAGDFVAIASLAGYSLNEVNFGLTGNSPNNDNELFMVRGDSLFLLSTPEYLQQDEFNIRLGAITNLHDSISTRIRLQLDQRAAIQNYSLPDTSLNVGESLQIVLDSVFADYTEDGLAYSFEILSPSIVTASQADRSFEFTALKYGHTKIAINAYDSYTATLITDTFSIQVYDPGNIAPTHAEYELISLLYSDTVLMKADTLFSDANEDSLLITLAPLNYSTLHGFLDETGHLRLWSDSAMTGNVDIIANDQRGGLDTLRLFLKFNTPPEKYGMLDSLLLSPGGSAYEVMLDSVYRDPDLDQLTFNLAYQCDHLDASLSGNMLSLEAESDGECSLFLTVDDQYGGLLQDTLFVMVQPNYYRMHYASFDHRIELFPNPAVASIQVRIDELTAGIYRLSIYDQLGIRKMDREIHSEDQEDHLIALPINFLSDGIYFLEVSTNTMAPHICRFVKVSSK